MSLFPFFLSFLGERLADRGETNQIWPPQRKAPRAARAAGQGPGSPSQVAREVRAGARGRARGARRSRVDAEEGFVSSPLAVFCSSPPPFARLRVVVSCETASSSSGRAWRPRAESKRRMPKKKRKLTRNQNQSPQAKGRQEALQGVPKGAGAVPVSR